MPTRESALFQAGQDATELLSQVQPSGRQVEREEREREPDLGKWEREADLRDRVSNERK
jgi:hypothetical protein